jgi:hypothetical protein
MTEPTTMLAIATMSLAALAMILVAGLKGWTGWLELKRLELSGNQGQTRSPALERIEVADLKERIRKLESLASCIDI